MNAIYRPTANGYRFTLPKDISSFADAAASALKPVLKESNGRRRERLLDEDDIAELIREACANGFAVDNGGTVANAYSYPASTTIALAYRRGRHLTVGIGVARANSPSLTQAWPEFYGEGNMTKTKPAKREKLLRRWARLKR